MNDFLTDLRHEFQRHKTLVDQSLSQLDDEQFFGAPGQAVNPVALIVKHLAGNLTSRWTDFLTTDGEKPTRERDNEFVLTDQDARPNLLAAWERAWAVLFATLNALTDADLDKFITIRGETHTARQALLRGITHVAYHTGQVLYLARLMRPQSPWLTIAPGQSRAFRASYREPPK